MLRLAWLLAVGSLWAQTTQGLISGRVTSQDGVAIAGAEVIGESLDTSTRATTRSDADGRFALPLLPPGRYRVTVAAARYQPQEIHEMEVAVAAFLDLPFRMRRAEDLWEAGRFQNLILPVRGTVLRFYGPDLDLSRSFTLEPPRANRGGLESTVSAVIHPALIRDLPLNGRDVYSSLVLQPAVAASATTARGIGVSAVGQRPSSAHFLLDGLENNNQLTTGPLSTVVPEAVQEFRLSTNNFSAEYGWTTGYLTNAVTRAGTANWHGLGYYYAKNERLNANDFARNAAGVDRSPLKEHEAGFQIGGPIWSDRLYQSASLDMLRSRGREDPLTFYLPSEAYAKTLASSPEDRESRSLFARFAPPAVPGEAEEGLIRTSTGPPVGVNRIVALERIDYLSRSGLHRWMGRAAVSRLDRPDFLWSPYPEFSSGLDQNSAGMALAVTSNFNPSITNEVRGGLSDDLLQFNRANPEIPTLDLEPNDLDAPVILPGSLAAYSFRNRARTWQLAESLVWLGGRHAFKFGGGFLARALDGYLTYGQAGVYRFKTLNDFRFDLPTSASVAISRQGAERRLRLSPDYDRDYHVRQFHAYAQDSFRITRRWTLNLGVRYERAGAPVNTGAVKDAVVALGPGANLPERLAGAKMAYPGTGDRDLYDARRHDWGLRVGLSYSPFANGNTAIRAAYGVFYDRGFDNLWLGLRNNSVVLGDVSWGPQGAERAVAYLDPPESVLASAPLVQLGDFGSRLTLVQPGLRSPRAQIAFAAVRQQMGPLALEIGGQAARGRGLITTDVVNRNYSRPGIPGGVFSRFQPDLQQIYYRASQGGSDYAALAILANYRATRLQWQVAYTWSHSIDNQSEPLLGEYFDLSFVRPGVSASGQASNFARQFDSAADRGNSDFDQRHNLVFYALWEPAGSSKWTRDWRVGFLGALRSGLPYSVIGGQSSDSPLLNNRANVVAPAAASLDRPAPGGRVLLNAGAFAKAPAALGNTGRNAFRGPGFAGVDLSISRGFRLPQLGDAGLLTVRADTYNVLNHANLGNPDAELGSSTFGLARYGRQEISTGFPAISPLRETARQVQLLLRLQF